MRFTLIRSLAVAAAVFAAMTVLSSTPHASQAGRESAKARCSSAQSIARANRCPISAPMPFMIREDGVRREVLRVSRATEPIDIALLVDNSAAARDDITFLRTGLSNFVARMATGNHVAVIALADRPTILVDYTDDTKRLTAAVGRLFAMSESGMTLLDGIYRDEPRARAA